MLNWYNS
jgi:hypothetical protein